MKKIIPILAIITFFSFGCGKKKVYQSAFQTFYLNPLYSGSHPSNFKVTYFLQENSQDVKIECNLQNILADKANQYLVSLHKSDTNTALGFEVQNTYNIGTTTALSSGAIAILLAKTDFETIDEFDGYLVIQDPNNPGIDSLQQLLIAQKLN
jgi:hypothetical protein